MKPRAALKVLIALVLALCAAGFVALWVQLASGSTDDRVYSAIQALPRCYADRDLPTARKDEQLRTVARAITAATTNRTERTLLVSIAYHESAICHDIHAGFCGPKQCDTDRTGVPRARSIYQTHRLGLSDADWDALVGTDYEATLLATRHALKQVRRSYAMCKGMPDPLWSTFVAYAGRGCQGRMGDVVSRLATFDRVWRRM